MISFIENIDRQSEVAYFALSSEQETESSNNSVPDLDAVWRAQKIVSDQGPFPDVDLIIAFLEKGIVRSIHKHLLRAHLDALDPPIDSFSTALFATEEQGRISDEELEVVDEALSVDWREDLVFDAAGHCCEVDENGTTHPIIWTEFDTVDPDNNLELQIAQKHNLNAYVYQMPLVWREGEPVTLQPIEHTLLGTVDDNGDFTPVIAVLHPSHPARSAQSCKFTTPEANKKVAGNVRQSK